MSGLRSAYCHAVGLGGGGGVNGSDGQQLGRFGDRDCDAPWLLATSAVEAMKKFKPDPDFIFWTGSVHEN